MDNPFSSSRLKLERAEYHISDIDERIDELISSGPHRVSVYTDSDTGYDVIQADVIDVVPEDFALVIGDALHNLKAALDFAVNEVVFRRLKRYDRYTRFPVRDTRDDLISAVNGGLIKQASEGVANLIVNVIKPYKGGNGAIWTLHDLNILDKHRLLVPLFQFCIAQDIRYENERGEETIIGGWIITGNRVVKHETRERNQDHKARQCDFECTFR